MDKQVLFVDGLRMSLQACATVLFSDNYLCYLRTAFRDGPTEVLQAALKSGHGSLHLLIAKFLCEAINQGVLQPIDVDLEAEILLAQLQGGDFLAALLCDSRPMPTQIVERIDVALASLLGRVT